MFVSADGGEEERSQNIFTSASLKCRGQGQSIVSEDRKTGREDGKRSRQEKTKRRRREVFV